MQSARCECHHEKVLSFHQQANQTNELCVGHEREVRHEWKYSKFSNTKLFDFQATAKTIDLKLITSLVCFLTLWIIGRSDNSVAMVTACMYVACDTFSLNQCSNKIAYLRLLSQRAGQVLRWQIRLSTAAAAAAALPFSFPGRGREGGVAGEEKGSGDKHKPVNLKINTTLSTHDFTGDKKK